MPDDMTMLAQRRKDELLAYVQNFYKASWDWRSQKKHSDWDEFDRNYHSIYNPDKEALKESWQSKMFVGITVQNVEIITSQIFKTMMAPKPPIKTEPGPAGDRLQAELIEDVLAYEMQKAQFDINFYDTLKEAVKYGSGFMKLFWEVEIDTRTRRVPVNESPESIVSRMDLDQLTGQAPPPEPGLMGFAMQKIPVMVKNQLCSKYVHIRDIFPEPNTTKWDKIIHRDKVTYGQIMANIQSGKWMDVTQDIENLEEGSKFESELQNIKQERGYFERKRDMSKYEKQHTVWELWAPIPRKWIQFDIPEGDEAEVLVPAKVMVASAVGLLSSEENDEFDGQVPILKLDYIRTGETYGKGVPELIRDEQDEINELRNQRVDNVTLILNKGIAVLENALSNMEEDLVSKPGWVLRLKQQVVDDVRKGFATIDFQDVTSSSYKETFEIERGVQERTGANRVTLGTSTEVRDTNQTLGGMEMLRQMFNERLAAYGMVMESSFLLKCAERIYALIYKNLSPDELKYILGTKPVAIEVPAPLPPPGLPPLPPQQIMIPRFMAFAYPPPEELGRSYRFKPMGIFSFENKVVKSAQIMDLLKLAGAMMVPMDMTKALQYVASELQGITEAKEWFMPMPMPMMGGLPLSAAPGLKGGENGDKPRFMPKNPINREPVGAAG